ncbi:MAG: hypothetical protein JW912_05505 [Sedimentisphaerales bacterium]|nr:hypothetical protein [Sedimentisphaerales bacterium]
MSDRTKTSNLAKTLLLVLSVLVIGLIVFVIKEVKPHRLGCRLVCATIVKGLGTSLMVYENDFGEIPENWCDALVDEADVHPKVFICPSRRKETVIGESSYAINKNVAGKQFIDLPPDIVVLFETDAGCDKSGIRTPIKEREYFNDGHNLISKYIDGEAKVYKYRWNQIGGPEILTTEHHDNIGCNILFGDGHAEFILTEDMSSLKWEVK